MTKHRVIELKTPHRWTGEDRYYDRASQRFYERGDRGQLVPVQNVIAAEAQQAQKGKDR